MLWNLCVFKPIGNCVKIQVVDGEILASSLTILVRNMEYYRQERAFQIYDQVIERERDGQAGIESVFVFCLYL